MPKESFPDALAKAAQGHQFTMVGDGHGDPAVARTFFSQETYDVLKRQGVKHIFLETPIEMQKYYDRYSAGKMTRKDFVETISEKLPAGSTVPQKQRAALFGLHADLLDRARKDGIQVHCANERYKMLDEMRKDPEVMRDYRKNAPFDAMANERVPLDTYLSLKKTERLPDGTMVSPRMSDQRVARFIHEKSGHEKAAVFYGALHLTTTHGMDELIGKDKCATVIVTNGMGDRLQRKFNDLVDGRWHGTYTPDPNPPTLSYDLSSGEATYGQLKPAEPQIDMTPLESAARPAQKPSSGFRP